MPRRSKHKVALVITLRLWDIPKYEMKAIRQPLIKRAIKGIVKEYLEPLGWDYDCHLQIYKDAVEVSMPLPMSYFYPIRNISKNEIGKSISRKTRGRRKEERA